MPAASARRGEFSALEFRKRLHDLSNSMTGVVGNLELVEMSMEDPELDLTSLAAAVSAARTSMQMLREMRSDLDAQLAS